jgi:hypothetical protein
MSRAFKRGAARVADFGGVVSVPQLSRCVTEARECFRLALTRDDCASPNCRFKCFNCFNRITVSPESSAETRQRGRARW